MGNFEDAYRQLNDAQKLAVDSLDGPVLVVAGPGTGKTQLLTTRIANILARTDTLPENILCLTFTDSAAHTMRERLTSIIGQAAYNITISTYHAFGSELIRRYPEYFTASNDLRPIDDLTIDSIFRGILERLPYSNPLKYDIFLRDVKTLVSDAKRALLTPKDLRKIASDNQKFIEAASSLTRKYLAELPRIDKASAELFESLAEQSKNLPQHSAVAHVIPMAQLWQQGLETALEDFHTTGKTTALTKWKNTWLAKNDAGEWIAEGNDRVRKIEAAATIYERYLYELAKSGLYDYDDMILHAIRGLETHADLRYTLQERYLYLLLDEFQDTNEAQSRLVELLTDNPVNEGRPNVLAVGDDDQAIYAFQGANYSHMLSFYEHYRDVLVVPLTANYRSHKDILHVAEGISGQIEERLHHHLPNVDKTLRAANDKLPKEATIERHEFKSDLSQNAWIAEQISKLVQEGIAKKDIAVLAPKHEYLEALVPFLHHLELPIHYDKRENVLDDETIRQLITMSRLILALGKRDHATANHLWPQVLSLRFWQLPTSLIWQLSWQAESDHTAWVDTLCGRADTKPIALFFIRLSQLAAAETLEQVMDKLIGVEPADLGEEGLQTYRSPFYEFYFGPLIDRHKSTTDPELPRFSAVRDDGRAPERSVHKEYVSTGAQASARNVQNEEVPIFWQLLSNLTVVRQHLREYRSYESEPLKLEDFVEFIEAHQEANIKILNTSPYQESTDAVELMTVYRAKGQEFAAVFIIGAIDEIWGGKARNVGSRLSLPANLQFIRYAGATEDERLRLLYVALTRAKTHLYITSYTSTYTGRLTNRLRYLDERAEEDGNIVSPLLPESEQVVRMEDKAPPQLTDLTIYWQNRHYRALRHPELKDLLAPRLEKYQLSPTQFNCFLDVPADGPTTFFIRNLLRFPSAPTISGAYGSAIHETLEWIHIYNKENHKLPTLTQILKSYERHLLAKRLGEPHNSLLIERGRECLTAYLAQRADTINADNLSETNFRSEGVFVGKAHLSGKIDKLIIDKKRKALTIVDYKTGHSYQRWAHETKLHFYRNQLYLYKILAERSHTFQGYHVEDAYLEFVEPDTSGQIRELHLVFDDAIQKEIEQLTEIVWNHAMNLDFPDITNYTADIKGIEAFEQDLLQGNT